MKTSKKTAIYSNRLHRLLVAAVAAVTAFMLSARDARAMTFGPELDARVEALLAKMTLDEKLGQLNQVSGEDKDGVAASEDLSNAEVSRRFFDMIKRGAYGSLIGCRSVAGYNAVQKAALAGRLGIPLLVGHDMIHGAVSEFPIPLALSCAWDTNLWYRCASAIAPETLLRGANWTFAPMLDISRDARWGRIAESMGQDPHLGYLFGYWWTKGLQGDDPATGFRIAACAKHYVGYGAAEGGRDYNRVEMSDSTLRNVYLAPFRGAVNAGLLTVMPAFHTFNDVPCAANRYLLTDVLRGELGFMGFTISDWASVYELREGRHGVAADDAEMAAKALTAGMDMEMLGGAYRRGVKEALARGTLDLMAVDEAVRRILRVKFALGLFEHPFIDEAAVSKSIDLASHRRLAREAAQKTTVLLKNENGVLPLTKGLKIALVGAFGGSTNEMKGCWSASDGQNVENPTLRDGLVANGFEVMYAPCWPATPESPIDEGALKAALAACDVVVACFGECLGMNGENTSRTDIGLPGEQPKAAAIIQASGKPFVAVLFNGRPMTVGKLAASADALVDAWNPGSCGGWGVADVLCGVVEPTARLTVDFPTCVGECPKYYNRTRTGRAQPDETDDSSARRSIWLTRYIDCEEKSIFPFGYGLSYTTFAYANEKVVREGDCFVVTADVTNIGTRVGTETVQLYLRDTVAQISRPRRELKAFEKVLLAPGETKSVRFKLGPNELGYWCGRDWTVERGRFIAWVASDSDSGKPLPFEY